MKLRFAWCSCRTGSPTTSATRDRGCAPAMWPGANTKALSKAFEQLEDQSLQFDSCAIHATGTVAGALCTGTAMYIPSVGNRTEHVDARKWSFEFRQVKVMSGSSRVGDLPLTRQARTSDAGSGSRSSIRRRACGHLLNLPVWPACVRRPGRRTGARGVTFRVTSDRQNPKRLASGRSAGEHLKRPNRWSERVTLDALESSNGRVGAARPVLVGSECSSARPNQIAATSCDYNYVIGPGPGPFLGRQPTGGASWT